MISNKKFKKILNDIKRRPEDASKELGIEENIFKKYLNGEMLIPFDIIKKCVELWSLNYNDFFSIEDDAPKGYKYMSQLESNSSQRLMFRNKKPYYLYKDTAYSRLSPFKPEWIEELLVVDNNDPESNQIIYNNGHFLHQFTYFIGDVNFYYIESGIKKVAVMNTGDSMYISPYIPHSFATRKNDRNLNGVILALTYADKLDHNCVDELNAIGVNLSKKFKMNLENEIQAFKSNLQYFLNVNSINLEIISKALQSPEIANIFQLNQLPNFEVMNKIAKYLEINLRDLLPIYNDAKVSIRKTENCNEWYYPDNVKSFYKFINLAAVKKLPISKAFVLEVLQDQCNQLSDLETPTHQYIYNIGKKPCKFYVNFNYEKEILPGDSLYLKPNLQHAFSSSGSKLLVLRTGGKISGDPLYHFSHVEDNQITRVIDDNKQWFNQ